jgi:hypothetical protein
MNTPANLPAVPAAPAVATSQDAAASAWALFFHTSTIREKKESTSIQQDAERADLMMEEFDKRFPR